MCCIEVHVIKTIRKNNKQLLVIFFLVLFFLFLFFAFKNKTVLEDALP